MKSFFILSVSLLVLMGCGKGSDSDNQNLSGNVLPLAAPEINIGGSEGTALTGQLSGKSIGTQSGASLSYLKATPPQNGQVTLNSETGSFTYIPNPGFSGVDYFSYRVFDGTNYSPEGVGGIVTIKVNSVAHAPVVNTKIRINMEEDAVAYSDTLKKYVKSDCDPNLLSFELKGDTDNDGWLNLAKGRVKLLDSSGEFQYILNHDAYGADSFWFIVRDNVNKTSSEGLVSIGVKAVDDPTIAHAATFKAKQSTVFSGKLIATDIDPGALKYYAGNVSGVTRGILTIKQDGTFTYQYKPAPKKECISGQACSEVFYFTAQQGANALATAAKVQIDILDDKGPSVVISSDKAKLKIGETAKITFVLNEIPDSFLAKHVVVAGGSLSNFAGSGQVYTAVFTPSVNSVADGKISVAANLFKDKAGNPNLAAVIAQNIKIDTLAPTVQIKSSKTALIKGETATITFTLSEVPAGFASGNVSVVGGQLSNFAVSGRVYTATFTPAVNSTVNGAISISANVFLDLADNGNLAAALASPITINTK